MTATLLEAPCNNDRVVATATEEGKSFNDVLDWFGLLGDGPGWNNPRTASGPGVATAKKWWKAVARRNPAPDNSDPYGFSYVDVMLDAVHDIQKQFDKDPEFRIAHLPSYCTTTIMRQCLALKKAFESGIVVELPAPEESSKAEGKAQASHDIEMRFATRDEDETVLRRLHDDAFLRALQSAICQHADNSQDRDAALMFITLLNDLEEIDLDDVPINPRGAPPDQLKKKQAIYLTSSPEEKVLLVTGLPETRARRFKRRITKLDELIAAAYTSVREGEMS